MMRSWSASPWSSKQMVFIPVSGSSVKIPSVLISRAVGGLGGIRRFRNLSSFLSHCQKVGICWQNSIRSSASSMPWRTLFKHSSWISLIGRRGSTLIASRIFSFMFSLRLFRDREALNEFSPSSLTLKQGEACYSSRLDFFMWFLLLSVFEICQTIFLARWVVRCTVLRLPKQFDLETGRVAPICATVHSRFNAFIFRVILFSIFFN